MSGGIAGHRPLVRCALALCLAGAAHAAMAPVPLDTIRLPSDGALREALLRAPKERALVLITAIGADPPSGAGAALSAALARREPAVVAAALRTLADQGERDPAVAARALALVPSGDPEVRAAACTAVGALGDAADAPALIDALGAPTVAHAAQQALITLLGVDCGADQAAWQTALQTHLDQRAVANARLREALQAEDPVRLIGAIGQATACDVVPARDRAALIAPLARHRDARVAGAAEAALNALSPDPAPVDEPPAAPATRPMSATPTLLATIAPTRPPLPLGTLLGLAAGIGALGALGALVFVLRTKDKVVQMTRRLTRRVASSAATLTKAIKRRITFTS